MDLEELEPTTRGDFRRANGAPQIVDHDGKNQRYSRPSGYGKPLDDENALVNWKINRAIEGVAQRPELVATALAADVEDKPAWKALREKAINAGRGDRGADTGTALHAMSERWEREPKYDPGPPFTESLEAYTAEMDRLKLISQRFEFQVVNHDYRAAGTVDRLYELTEPLVAPSGEILSAGSLVIGDLKTNKNLDFSVPGYAVQMALYAQGEFYDVEDDTHLPTPEINQLWGILAWMPATQPGVCEFHWVDLDVGNYGAWMAQEIKEWRKKWRKGDYAAPVIMSPGEMPEVIESEPLAPIVADATAGFDEALAWLKERLAKVSTVPEAKKWMLFQWPEGLLTPKKMTTMAEIDAAVGLLDSVEARFELPFGTTDPRIEKTKKQNA